MEVSVIIPTYNGERKISGILDALLVQSFKHFEVVVVIDGSTDGTEKILDSYKKRFPHFKVIWQQNSGRAIVRNRGAKESKGDILIFFDDDVIPQPDCINRHVNFHASHAAQSILQGSQLEQYSSRQTDVQNYRAFLSRKWLSPYPNGLSELSAKNLFFSAANCSMKRIDFEHLNGFDVRLTDAEDFDLALRALRGGIHVFFDKENNAFHNDKISARSYIKRLRDYQTAHVKLSNIHQTSVRRQTPWSKKMIYHLFAFKFWLTLIDFDILKYMLPSALRFKFYELVFQSLAVEYPNKELN